MITGAAQMDGAIPCGLTAADGPSQTREHILLGRQVGIPTWSLHEKVTSCTNDELCLELVEMESRELSVLLRVSLATTCPGHPVRLWPLWRRDSLHRHPPESPLQANGPPLTRISPTNTHAMCKPS